MSSALQRRVAVVGAGIAGASAALELAQRDDVEVTIYERSDVVGGRLQSSPFAGVDAIDTSADAFLARVPDAVDLAHRVGLTSELVHPEPVGAAVWHGGLHAIPDGLLLGVPSRPIPLLRSGLLSTRGKLRAALEPLLPRTSIEDDSIGSFIRARFGNEIHDRLVDALVGSIYATDTDRFSLAEVPQLAALTSDRSITIASRRAARSAPSGAGTATAAAAPIFAAPRRGMSSLVDATIEGARGDGARLVLDAEVAVESSGNAVIVADDRFDAAILAVPARAAVDLLHDGPSVAAALAEAEAADVVMITIHVSADEWPERLRERSGYLVPKSVQRHVTAASFGSQKWAHWRPPGGGEILRVSVGRDGAPVLHLDDAEIVDRALDDLALQLGIRFTPREVRVTRWPGAFAQYRPHHRRWVDAIRASLPNGVFVAGSSYDGIGVPACVRSGRTNAERALIATDAVAH